MFPHDRPKWAVVCPHYWRTTMPFRNRFQSDLDTAVADATGEDLRTIRRRGFSLVDPHNVNFDPEPDLLPPQFIDWDELDRSRNEPVVRQPLRVARRVA